MALVSGRCPNCGGEPQLDDSEEKGFCVYCGSLIQVRDAVTKLKVELSGNVKVDGVTEKAKLKDAAQSLWDMGKFSEAAGNWHRVTKIDPTDGEAYVGLCKFQLKNLAEDYKKSAIDVESWDEKVVTENANYLMAKKYATAGKFAEIEKQYKNFSAPIKAEQKKIKAEKAAQKAKDERFSTIMGTTVIFFMIATFVVMLYIGFVVDGVETAGGLAWLFIGGALVALIGGGIGGSIIGAIIAFILSFFD